jgi:hypothetical protein
MWSRVLEKLIVTQLVKKFPALYGTRRFSASQELSTGPCPEPDASSSFNLQEEEEEEM